MEHVKFDIIGCGIDAVLLLVSHSPSVAIEYGPYTQYYTISARHEDRYFAECIVNDKKPEFTPEQAKEAVVVVLLSYLSAKKGRIITMDELLNYTKKEGTPKILEGFLLVIQKNYDHLNC